MPDLEHKEYFRGKLYAYSAPDINSLTRAVTQGRANQGRNANYSNIFNELSTRLELKEVAIRRKPSAALRGVNTAAVINDCPSITPQGAFAAARSVLNDALGNIESQEEINRRASICLNCPKKIPMKGCVPCGAVARAKEFLNTQRRKLWKKGYDVPQSVATLSCGVCCCHISAMLPAPLADFKYESAEQNAKRPSNCWLKKP